MKWLGPALVFSFSVGLWAGPSSGPANPNATPETRAVLGYFQSISGRPSSRIISGQFADFGRRASLRLVTAVAEKTGHWPALMGVDYADFGRRDFATTEPNQAAIAYWKQGGLVTVSAHLYNPASTNSGGLRSRNVDLSTLLEAGGETHQRWMQELDQLAGGLRELQDAGVVVLWRPFHEMNGNWFWWGGKDPATFIKLWRQMFDYFTRVKGLNNLLWIYAPNHGGKTAAYYAGDNYVDLVGLDVYTDFVDQGHVKGYAEVAALPKPFGFTEYGPHGSRNPPGDFDYMRLLAGLRRDFPKTSFFMCWNANWSLATNLNTRSLLSSPLLVNRSDLPTHRQ